MRSVLIAGSLLLSASSLAHAQQPQTPSQQPAAANVPTAEDFAAVSDARIAAIKEGLKLKPDQEKIWASFESTLRDIAKGHQERLKQVLDAQKAAQGSAPDPAAMLRLRANALAQESADLKRFADAVDPLYKALDDGQKRRMVMLVASVAPR
jgi:nitrate/nitrite-specific signal transduction histidine kinase